MMRKIDSKISKCSCSDDYQLNKMLQMFWPNLGLNFFITFFTKNIQNAIFTHIFCLNKIWPLMTLKVIVTVKT